MEKDELQYHIGLRRGQVGRYVFLPGDPGRAELIASHLDGAKKIAENREYVTFTGELEGVAVSVTSTGIGGPSTAICMEELHRIGADTMIRIGTSGSLQPHVKIGELVIATAVVRDEGTSLQYVPMEYPAVADFDVVQALRQSARDLGHKHHLGIVHCKDAFFAEEPEHMANQTYWEERWKMWQRSQVLCTEMEGATLFVVGHIRKIRVGEIVAVIGETHAGQAVMRKEGINEAIQTAVEAVRVLIREDRQQQA